MTSDTDQAALAEFPELCRLIDLRQTGRWLFLAVVSDGQVTVGTGCTHLARWLG